MHLSVNNQQHSVDKDTDTNKDMDMEADSSPLTSTPIIAVKEPTSLPSPHPTDNVVDVRPASSPPPSVEGDPKDITPLPDSVTIKHHPTESTPPKTTLQPTSNNMAVSTSSSLSSSMKPSSPTRKIKPPSPLTPIPSPPTPSVRTPVQPKPLHVKYNADGNLTLPDFARKLQQAFDRNPTIFKTNVDRIKYALHSMGEHTSRYFEPFRNKSVPDSRKCLKPYHAFLMALLAKFGEPPSLDAICDATAQLLFHRQTGSMSSFIATFRDLAAVVCWEESLLMRLFAEALSPEVKTLLGDPNDIQSLSMLQVAATRVYSMHRTQPHLRIFDQNHHHSTSLDGDLDRAQELMRQQNQHIYQVIRDSAALTTENPPLTSTRIATLTCSTDTVTDSVSSIATTNTAATARAKVMIPSVHAATGAYFKSHARGKLTEEVKQYRKDNHLCLYCGGEGHLAHLSFEEIQGRDES